MMASLYQGWCAVVSLAEFAGCASVDFCGVTSTVAISLPRSPEVVGREIIGCCIEIRLGAVATALSGHVHAVVHAHTEPRAWHPALKFQHRHCGTWWQTMCPQNLGFL